MDYRERRKEQARQTEAAILQAALELARANSFDKVSVRDICQRAGITTGAFYHHFRSKEDLLPRGFAPLDRRMEEALTGHGDDTPPERLWRILSTYAAFIQDQGWELGARSYPSRGGAPRGGPAALPRQEHQVPPSPFPQPSRPGGKVWSAF